ncbi:MAG: aspartyl/asparaginyl beta-hydroxylase domain-containing protein [Caulobacteraceae bacterium]
MNQARMAIARRDPAQALRILDQADTSIEVFLDRAVALRMLGDVAAAIGALDSVLALDPRNFVALLSKGALLERVGQRRRAAITYKAAVAVAPRETELATEFAGPLRKAKQLVAAHSTELADHLRQSTAAVRSTLADDNLGRFDEALDIYAGLARAHQQEPLLLHYPRLPAIPFYETRDFPWLGKLEAATSTIAEELKVVMATRLDHFTPYIDYPPSAPVDQWAELNHNPKWSTYFLWRDGVRQAEACALCPRTAALVDELPLADQPGFSPTVVFSVLDARTRIPPHTGSSNIRLIGHLPLILPGPAGFRVGNVTRQWRVGEAWLFDDTIEHEAWNDADEPRVILIFDVWNPLLTPGERALVSAMMTAKNEFEAAP